MNFSRYALFAGAVSLLCNVALALPATTTAVYATGQVSTTPTPTAFRYDLAKRATATIIPPWTISYPVGPLYNQDVITLLDIDGQLFLRADGQHVLTLFGIPFFQESDGGFLYGPVDPGLGLGFTFTGVPVSCLLLLGMMWFLTPFHIELHWYH